MVCTVEYQVVLFEQLDGLIWSQADGIRTVFGFRIVASEISK